ncbi:helix-turn-helix domain-containing protein [Spirillospora sp. NPDC052269]
MTDTLDHLSGPLGIRVPRNLARLMRDDLPAAIDEVDAEIRRTVPEYDRPADSAYGRILRVGVEQMLTAFVTQVAGDGPALAERDETCRALGHFEAIEGRSLDLLQAAYRTAFHVCYRRTVAIAEREGLHSGQLSGLVEAMIVYVDEAVAAARIGHRQALKHADLHHREVRQELLRTLLRQPPASAEAIEELARNAAWWPLPEVATAVAVAPGAPCTRSALDGDVLIDLDDTEPRLLIPGPFTPARAVMLGAALEEADSVLGLTLPLGRVAHGLRWAVRLLELTREGVIPRGSLIPCEEHLTTLWLLSDTVLADEMARRHLAPLADLTAGHRRKLTATLTEWVTTRGTAVDIAESLRVHPQTVRYRLRQLDHYLGDSLGDPKIRFALDVTLRAASLMREDDAPAARSGRDSESRKRSGK